MVAKLSVGCPSVSDMSMTTFDPPAGSLLARLRQLSGEIAALCAASATSVPVAELGEILVELERLQDRLAGLAAEWTLAFDQAGGPEECGAPTLNAWARRELRVTPVETKRRTKRAEALRALGETREAFTSGRFGVAQLDAIAHGLHLHGVEMVGAIEPVLVEVASTCDADAVRTALRRARDTLDPDAADAAYIRALERRDLTITAVGEGYDVRGFLDPETGVALREVLYSFAKPTSADDDRPAGHRRVDGVRELCRSFLDHGLATDRGLRPHLYVTVPAARLATACSGEPAQSPVSLPSCTASATSPTRYWPA